MSKGQIKVLTACGTKHAKYMDGCRDSVAQLDGVKHEWIIGAFPKSILMNILLNRVNDDDVVIFLDADDYITGDIHDSLVAMMQYDLVYRDVHNKDQHDNVETFISQPFNYEDFKKRNFIPFSGVMARGWLVKKEEYPNNFPTEDWTYWHKLYQHSQKFGYVEGTFVTRRTWTSHVWRSIPLYSKIRRLIRKCRTMKINSQYYVE